MNQVKDGKINKINSFKLLISIKNPTEFIFK